MNVLLADNSNESACGCESLLRELDLGATIHRAMSLRDALTLVKDLPQLDLIVWHAGVQTNEKFSRLQSLAAMPKKTGVLAGEAYEDVTANEPGSARMLTTRRSTY